MSASCCYRAGLAWCVACRWRFAQGECEPCAGGAACETGDAVATCAERGEAEPVEARALVAWGPLFAV